MIKKTTLLMLLFPLLPGSTGIGQESANTKAGTMEQRSISPDCDLFRKLWVSSSNRFVDMKSDISTAQIIFPSFGKAVDIRTQASYDSYASFEQGAFYDVEFLFYSGPSESQAKALYEKLKGTLNQCSFDGGNWYDGDESKIEPNLIIKRVKVAGYVDESKKLVSPRIMEAGLADNSRDMDVIFGGKAKMFFVYLYVRGPLEDE